MNIQLNSLRLDSAQAALKAIELVKNKADRCTYITTEAVDDSPKKTVLLRTDNLGVKSEIFDSERLPASKVAKLSPCTNSSNSSKFHSAKIFIHIGEIK